jgi:hypothetical protein
MSSIDNKLEIEGYAWLEADGSIMWAVKKDLQNIPPKERPNGCTPVMIEIYPTEEWYDKTRKEKEFMGDLASQVNLVTEEINALQRELRARG